MSATCPRTVEQPFVTVERHGFLFSPLGREPGGTLEGNLLKVMQEGERIFYVAFLLTQTGVFLGSLKCLGSALEKGMHLSEADFIIRLCSS